MYAHVIYIAPTLLLELLDAQHSTCCNATNLKLNIARSPPKTSTANPAVNSHSPVLLFSSILMSNQ